MKISIPIESIFGVGILLFTFSMWIYASITKKLLKLIQKRSIWILPVISVILLVLGAFIHFYRLFFYSDALSHADPMDLFPLIIGLLKASTGEALMIFGAAIFGLVGSVIYYRWISR